MTDFLLSSANMITRKMTPFFHLLFEFYSLVYFIFIFQDLQNSVPWGPCPPLHYVLVCKIHIYMPKTTLSSLLTWLCFFYIKFTNFWYIKSSVPNLTPIWTRSHGLRRCSVKKGVLKNFINSTGKRLCWSPFLIKLQPFRPTTLLKKDSNTGAFL